MIESRIKGTGIYLPRAVKTNADLEKMVDTDDEWIFERTGIRQRHICSTEGGEWPTDMAHQATCDMLAKGGYGPNIIDMILFATLTPDFQASQLCLYPTEEAGHHQ